MPDARLQAGDPIEIDGHVYKVRSITHHSKWHPVAIAWAIRYAVTGQRQWVKYW